jgi:hypothetical protein
VKRLTGLFLGAGASCEVGMPLVWELTEELKNFLTPARLRSLNKSWHAQGGGHSDETIDEFARLLERTDLHYEALLGWLETGFRRSGPRSQEFHALYSWLAEMVYWLLHERHINNKAFIEGHIRHLDGIARLADQNLPLWIFSLNHDLIVECLAATHQIAINAGFSSELVSLPRRDGRGNKIGELHAETMTVDHLERTGLPFLRHGEHGINLLKIHGALDVFAFRDGKDLLRLRPTEQSVHGVLEALRIANAELIYYEPRAPNHRIKTTNEITYADDDGEMQFLRRTLLAGAYKFQSRASQVVPMKLLDHFRQHINNVSRLICVGYGFGDLHINQVIRSWLEFSAERCLVIVAPGSREIPSSLLHVAPQITLEPASASDFLDKSTGIARSRQELLTKRVLTWARAKLSIREQQQFRRIMKQGLHALEAAKRYSDRVLAEHEAESKKTQRGRK